MRYDISGPRHFQPQSIQALDGLVHLPTPKDCKSNPHTWHRCDVQFTSSGEEGNKGSSRPFRKILWTHILIVMMSMAVRECNPGHTLETCKLLNFRTNTVISLCNGTPEQTCQPAGTHRLCVTVFGRLGISIWGVMRVGMYCTSADIPLLGTFSLLKWQSSEDVLSAKATPILHSNSRVYRPC
jgi:hypothetical protein